MSVIVAKGVAQCCTTTTGCGPVVPVSSKLVLIYPGQTEIVDVLDVSDFLGTKWLIDITAITTSNQHSMSYEAYATHSYGVNPSHITYSHLGHILPHTRAVSIVGTDMRLSITNTSGSDVYLVGLTRIPIISSAYSSQIITGTINPTSVPFTNISTTIAASTSNTVIDTLSFTKYLASKWIIKITDTVTNDALSVEVYGNEKETSITRNNVYSNLGTLNQVRVKTQMTGNNFQLIVDNLRANPVDIRAVREPVILDSSVLCCVCNCSSINVIPVNDVTITPSSTITVDTIAVASTASIKWLFVLRNPTTSKVQIFQVHATSEDGVTPIFNVYGLTGDIVLCNINVAISGGSYNLNITNQGINNIKFDAANIIILQ